MSPSSVGLGRRPAWAPAPICAVPRTAVPPPGDGHGGPERTAGRRGGGAGSLLLCAMGDKRPQGPTGLPCGGSGATKQTLGLGAQDTRPRENRQLSGPFLFTLGPRQRPLCDVGPWLGLPANRAVRQPSVARLAHSAPVLGLSQTPSGPPPSPHPFPL